MISLQLLWRRTGFLLGLGALCLAPPLLLPNYAFARIAQIDNGSSDPRQQLEQFCGTHAKECATLESLHLAVRNVCGVAPSNRMAAQNVSTACRSAVDAEMAQIRRLEAAGLPHQANATAAVDGSGKEKQVDDDAGLVQASVGTAANGGQAKSSSGLYIRTSSAAGGVQ